MNLIGVVLLVAALIGVSTGAVMAAVGESTGRRRRTRAGLWMLVGSIGVLLVSGVAAVSVKYLSR